jgi:transcriptional regulator with XRE-family HTH domain
MATATQTQGSLPPLRTVRLAQGLTLRETARRADVHVAHLSRVERGEATLSLDALYRVARVLGIRPVVEILEQYRAETFPEKRDARRSGHQGRRAHINRGRGYTLTPPAE